MSHLPTCGICQHRHDPYEPCPVSGCEWVGIPRPTATVEGAGPYPLRTPIEPAPDLSGRPLHEDLAMQAAAGVWMAVHGFLCLALRHPGVQGPGHPSTALARDFRDSLGAILVEMGVLTTEELAEAERIELAAQAKCEVCGCTPDKACPGGCAWDPAFAQAGRAVCSRCTDKATPLAPRILRPEDPEFGATLEELGGR